MIFAGIDTRGRLKSPLKIKGVFQDISVRFEDTDSRNRDFGPSL